MTTLPSLVRRAGLVLFLTGFGLFVLSFFAAAYRLDETAIRQVRGEGDPATEILIDQTTDLRGQTYRSVFAFVADLRAAFDRTNEVIRQQYTLSDTTQEALLSAGIRDGRFDLQAIDQVLGGEGEADQARREGLRQYAGWLADRTFDSDEAAAEQVRQTIAKYEQAAVRDQGLDRYARKSLRFALTKAANVGWVSQHPWWALLLTYGLAILGGLLYNLPKAWQHPPGIQHHGVFQRSMTNRGWLGWLTGLFLIAFYVLLYFFPEYMNNWVVMVDPVSQQLSGNPAGYFFLYGLIYTLCILVMGIRMFVKYRHSRYHLIRTASVMFFQLAFAFLIPEILIRLQQPYYDFKNIWPLDYDFFFDSNLNQLLESGTLGVFMLVWGIILIILAVPLLTYFLGKRWYCSWVCGCGGLAETLGDPYRQLSDKSLRAWQIERYSVHGVLVLAVVMTAGVLYTYFTGSGTVLGLNTYDVREAYGFWIGAGFAGVVGTGFYPVMGNRVWCRFGCPLAAYLGIVQRFRSRFRITTNGGQCISCGNCSTFCEMGIDVRWYAQRGEPIVRASCVGCGVCASVCPRGVLRLENGPVVGRLADNQ